MQQIIIFDKLELKCLAFLLEKRCIFNESTAQLIILAAAELSIGLKYNYILTSTY